MNKDEWILKELDRLYNQSENYNQMALIKAAQALITEQSERIVQMEATIEGTLWSPKKWRE